MSREPRFHYSPRSFAGERIGEIESQQRATLSNGPRDTEDPTGNDCVSWAHCPKYETCAPDMETGKVTDPVSRPVLDPEALFGEDEILKAQKQKKQGSRGTTPMVRGCFEREGADPAHGQNGADHECLNGSQMPINKEARDMAMVVNGPTINLGLTNHTTAIFSQNNCNSPQYHKLDNGSTWKVYSRNRGCRKQQAHIISGNEKLTEAVKTLNNQQQAFVDMDTTITGFEGRNTPMDTSPLQHGVQNKNVETSPNTDGVSIDQLKETTSK